MAMTLLPFTARVRQRLTRQDFARGCEEVREIAPSTKREVPPAQCLPDDPDRILGFQEETTPELDRRRAAGGMTEHGPTTIAMYRNVTIVDGLVCNNQGMFRASNRYATRPFARGERVEIDRALLCTHPVIDRYFGHWLVDGLLLETMAMEEGLLPFTVSPNRWLHEPGYRALTALHDRRERFAHIRELSIADDRGVNQHWQRRMTALRARIAASIDANASHSAPVFVLRGTSGSKREMVNGQALADEFSRRGFVVLAPELEEPATIAATLSNAPLIVLVEGSAQDHALVAARSGAWMVTIMPPHRVNCFAKTRADAVGLNWAYTVADDAGEGSFYQPPERVLRLIDQVVA